MNKNWTKNINKGNESSRSGRGKGRRARGSTKSTNHSRFGRSERQFPKFVDNDHMNNDPNYKSQNDWNCNNRNNNYVDNGSTTGAGIFPWIRKKPANPFLIPPRINLEERNEYQEAPCSYKPVNKQITPNPVSQIGDQDINIDKNGSDSLSTINNNVPGPIETSKLPEAKNVTVKIEGKESLLINLKQERKSSSSSSSSSTESSSSEEDSEHKNIQMEAAKPVVKLSSNAQPSPLKIKLKTKPESEQSSSSSSSSSSSEESESLIRPPLKSATKANKMDKLQNVKKEVKTKSTKKTNSSEDDVVCIGNLENKIVLEDEDDKKEKSEKNANKSKTSNKKSAVELCMICDKKGHTSFQCQMICKNCSTPHHGYRTCPHPANLNTMLQLFMELCMQQFQKFIVEKEIGTNFCDSVPKPQIDSQYSANVSNKSNKHKHKQAKVSEINTKTKVSKKRKMSLLKKSKAESNDSSDDEDNDEDDAHSDTSSPESKEDFSDSTVESLVSSKRKRKMKSKNASKSGHNLSNITANPVNLPIVLNGFPNLTVPTASIHNTNTSTALNTLLLTQMLQNAIGSIQK